MLSPEEITKQNRAQVQAIFERFEKVEDSSDLQKSEDTGADDLSKQEDATVEKGIVFTHEDLNQFKEDLFKGIDDGTIDEDQLEKAQNDILSLKKETRKVEGKEVEVFVRG